MTKEADINFTREAFMHPLNLGFLTVAALTAFFLSDAGLVSNAILSVAFGFELMYLGTLPRTEFFRKLMSLKQLRARKSEAVHKEVFGQLDPATQKRFLVLKHLSKLIRENFTKMPYTSQGLLQNIQTKLDGLLTNYLNLLDSYRRYSTFIQQAAESKLLAMIEEEKSEMEASTSEKLKSIKQRRILILTKRFDRIKTAREKYLICETQLETIEDAVKYIYEQSLTMNNPEEIGFQLDNLLNEVEETSSIFEELETEIPGISNLDELDAQLNSVMQAKAAESASPESPRKSKESN